MKNLQQINQKFVYFIILLFYNFILFYFICFIFFMKLRLHFHVNFHFQLIVFVSHTYVILSENLNETKK